MNYWIMIHNWGSWLVILLGVAVLVFSKNFYRMRIVEDSEDLAPGWFRPLFVIGSVLGIFWILLQIGTIISFVVYVMFDIVSHPTNLILVILVGGIIIYEIIMVNRFGLGIRKRFTSVITEEYFDKDEIVKKLLEDISRGVQEIRIYQNRIEAIRSFNFDVDGYNLPGYSRTGCMELAEYLCRKTKGEFYFTEQKSLSGARGSRSALNILNNGEHFEFKYVDLVRNKEE